MILTNHDKGATVRIPNEDKRIPLHYAVEFSARVDIKEKASPQELKSNYSDYRSSLSSYSNFKKSFKSSVLYAKKLPHQILSLSWIRMETRWLTFLLISHVIKGIAHTEKEHFRVEECKYSVCKKQKKEWEKQGSHAPLLSSNIYNWIRNGNGMNTSPHSSHWLWILLSWLFNFEKLFL